MQHATTCNMRRVSSRPRFVSWDAFDATTSRSVYDVDTSEDEESSDDRRSSNISTRRKLWLLQKSKRKRATTSKKSTTSPASNYSVTGTSVDSCPLDEWMPDDVLLHILHFVDGNDCRNVMQISHSYRNLLANKVADELWMQQYCIVWPWMRAENDGGAELTDALDLATSVVDESVSSLRPVNHALLLSLASSVSPTRMTILPLQQSTGMTTRSGGRREGGVPRQQQQQLLLEIPETRAILFTGQVGMGDRCIRADQPFPRPVTTNSRMISPPARDLVTNCSLQQLKQMGLPSSILQRLARGLHAPQEKLLRPFVVPFVGSDHKIHLTPRLVAYFEVTILPRPAHPLASRPHHHQHRPNFNNINNTVLTAPECIAVGIATSSFAWNTRMPGWDQHSFGYHGDDGGIFHGHGNMVRAFGPSFGSGDTVGCGIQYHGSNGSSSCITRNDNDSSCSIFFTLNGTFLDYAWTRVACLSEQDWYPVVGLDSNCPVACNFGCSKPFLFDLNGMVIKGSEEVLHSLGIQK
jgi:hypothetical protein